MVLRFIERVEVGDGYVKVSQLDFEGMVYLFVLYTIFVVKVI